MDIPTILFSAVSLGGMGLVFGLGLGFAGKKFEVFEDPRILSVKYSLPGANCGGCGYAGCEALANAIVAGEAKPNACPVGNSDMVVKISEIMGVSNDFKEKQIAFVKCNGDCNKSNSKYEYFGMLDCNAAAQLAGGGSKSCSYACLGGGTCVNACQFGAIDMINGIAVINKEKCTACTMCVVACPKVLIELVPYVKGVKVSCNSKDNGKEVKSNCTVGCIGCKICEKACNYDAIHVKDFLAKVDYVKCVECNECVAKCPMATIGSETYDRGAADKMASIAKKEAEEMRAKAKREEKPKEDITPPEEKTESLRKEGLSSEKMDK